MTEHVPGPAGRQPDCIQTPERLDGEPNCRPLKHFLTRPTLIDYDYYLCPRCHRIWEKSFFYQDWEPHWYILAYEAFRAKREVWIGDSGKDHYPEQAFAGGQEGFVHWVNTTPSLPILAGTEG